MGCDWLNVRPHSDPAQEKSRTWSRKLSLHLLYIAPPSAWRGSQCSELLQLRRDLHVNQVTIIFSWHLCLSTGPIIGQLNGLAQALERFLQHLFTIFYCFFWKPIFWKAINFKIMYPSFIVLTEFDSWQAHTCQTSAEFCQVIAKMLADWTDSNYSNSTMINVLYWSPFANLIYFYLRGLPLYAI